MPIIQIAQSIGVFLSVCVAAAIVLSLIVIGLERLEMATVPVDRHDARRHHPGRRPLP